MSVQRRTTTKGVRWEVRLRDPDGREYSRWFATRGEAEAFHDQERSDRRRGAWVDPRSVARPFAVVVRDWQESNPAKRTTSRVRDEGDLRLHILPALGARPIGSIRPRDVQALVNGLTTMLSPSSVRRVYAVVRAVFNYAVETDTLGRSPCRGIKLPKVERARRTRVTGDGLVAIAAAAGEAYAPLVLLAGVLGLRWGEVAGLSVRSLDVLRSTVTIDAAMTRDRKGAPVLGVPKSEAGRRTLAVPQPLTALLADHLRRRGLTAADGDELVFTSARGAPLRYSNFRRNVWLHAVAAAGLDGVTFHDLRRAAATALVVEGVDPKTVQARLGHSDVRLTLEVYAQVVSEADRDAADRAWAHFTGDDTASEGVSARRLRFSGRP
jgi:integrase